MKLVTAEQMRELDRRVVEETEVTGETLMERAGYVLAGMIRRLADSSSLGSPVIHFIAGRGNNGGDAFVAARLLHDSEYTVHVWLAAFANQVHGDALLHFSRMKQQGVAVEELPTLEDWQDAARQPLFADIVVDGVLGTGLRGPARGPAAGAIHYINRVRADALCVAIDIPSGLDADTGKAGHEAVIADLTVTMGLPKLGFVTPEGIAHVGSVEVADIGIPREFVDEVEPAAPVEMIDINDLRPLFRQRPRHSHKGTCGHVLVLSGCRRYCGAPALAGEAALRAGAGLVTVATPACIHGIVAGHAPTLMVQAAPELADGTLSRAFADVLLAELDRYAALVIGPGLEPNEDLKALLAAVLPKLTVPVVLDAGALDALDSGPEELKTIGGPVVITPHPGEMGRLLGRTADAVEKDRLGAARDAAERGGCITVLKGAGTVVIDPADPVARINLSGNPGMASAGTGDVLSGLLGGLLAQGYPAAAAARIAVHLHGLAGDMAARRLCQTALTATDLLDDLPFAIREWTLR